MRGEEDLKSAQRRPKRQRPRMSEDEDINFDASASRYECPSRTRGNSDFECINTSDTIVNC